VIEPTTQTATALAASLSGITLALLGVDYYSLLYAFVGALFALYEAERMGRGKAVLFAVLSTLAGAVMGSLLPQLVGSWAGAQISPGAARLLLMAGSIVCGFGMQSILARLLRRSLLLIDGKTPAAAAGDDGGKNT
jgi:hypothetical protein